MESSVAISQNIIAKSTIWSWIPLFKTKSKEQHTNLKKNVYTYVYSSQDLERTPVSNNEWVKNMN